MTTANNWILGCPAPQAGRIVEGFYNAGPIIADDRNGPTAEDTKVQIVADVTETDYDAYKQSNAKSCPVEAYRFKIGVAEQKVGDQGRNAGGEHHGIGLCAQLLLLHQAVEAHTQDGGDHVQRIDAPGAETDGQQYAQGGYIVGLTAGQEAKRGAEQTNQTHV